MCDNDCIKPIEIESDLCTDGERCFKVSSLQQLYATSPVPISIETPESSELELMRKLLAEFLGTMLLLIVVASSGIMAEKLSTDVGIQLLQNAISTCGGLTGLILMFGPVSGAHFNPVVSLIDFLHSDMSGKDLILYTVMQVSGAIVGALISNIQFQVRFELSTKERNTSNLWLSEVIGTATLLLLIHSCVRTGRVSVVPFAVGGWICGGYFFTSSTIFANPAVTIGRMFTNTFSGIEPRSAGIFIAFQLVGCFVGYLLIRLFYPRKITMRKDDNLYMRVCIKDIESSNICK